MDESEVWNVSATNVTTSIFGVEGYYAFVSVILATLVPAQLFLSVITIVGLCVGKEFKQFKLQRALMIAMVAMGFVSSTSVVMYSIAEYLFLNRDIEVGAVFCHGGLLFGYLDYVLRDILLVFFSVLVFIVIKYGRQKVRVAYFSIALLLVVSTILIVSIVFLIPSVVDFSLPIDGAVCRGLGSLASYTNLAVLLALSSIPSRVISVGIVIATLAFVKQHSDTLGDNKKFKVAVLKFLAIVAIMNGLLIAQGILTFVVPLLVRVNETAFIIIAHLVHFVLPNVPAIITPLLLIVVFKPLTAAIKTLVLPSCCESPNFQANVNVNAGTQITMTSNSGGSSDKEDPLLRMRA